MARLSKNLQPKWRNPMSMTSLRDTLSRESAAATGGFVDAIGGIATIVLAVLGLAGVRPTMMVGIATVIFGVALLIQGGAMLSEYTRIIFPPARRSLPLMNSAAAACPPFSWLALRWRCRHCSWHSSLARNSCRGAHTSCGYRFRHRLGAEQQCGVASVCA